MLGLTVTARILDPGVGGVTVHANTASHHEHKISSIREKYDINDMSIERLYENLKLMKWSKSKGKSFMDQGQWTARILPY